MVILIVESAPPGLRGELTKWMIEPKAGVYVGTISGAVRDLLWKKACAQVKTGGCTMIYSAANEQGFAIRSWGDTTRVVDQWEGLYLVRRLPRADDRVMQSASHVMRLWAKADPFQPLPCHLVDVGHVALALLETTTFRRLLVRLADAMNGSLEQIKSWIGYLIALHDWGKAWRNFQGRNVDGVHPALYQIGLNLNVEEQERSIRHEAISRMWIEKLLMETWKWDRRSLVTVSAAIGAHHGRVGQRAPKLNQFPGRDRWEALVVETEQLVRSAFMPPDWKASFRDHSVVGMILAGLTVWSDWIASNVHLFPLRWQGEEWLDYNSLSQVAAKRAVQKLGLFEDNPWKKPRTFLEMWPEIEDPRPVQIACTELAQSKLQSGLVIIEAPMGEGKTEAALFLASRWMQDGGGIYIALPTAATSNQMFSRVRPFVLQQDPEAAGVQLVHGTSWMVDKHSPEKAPEVYDDDTTSQRDIAFEWFLPRKRSLLATYGVGTIDQALMSVLHVKHGFLRLLGLSGKVLMIDEVHAYDAYMTQILARLLGWCRVLDIRVILLSATLPDKKRKELIRAYAGDAVTMSNHRSEAYPLITAVSSEGDVEELPVSLSNRRYDINIVRHEGLLGDHDGVADLAVEILGDEGCACVIANTVRSAQEIYESIKIRYPEIESLLFHSRFLARDRQRIENAALNSFDKRSLLHFADPESTKRPRKAILVATQVVEQSLDLDFDAMITEIAPIDLLLQRVGRLHRHNRPHRPKHFYPPTLHVLLPPPDSLDFQSTERVYERYFLMQTKLNLSDEWQLPTDMRTLIESVYGKLPADGPLELREELARAYDKMQSKQEDDKKKALKYLIAEPYLKAFKLERSAYPLFEEEDEGLQSYFTAKTRQGDQTVRILAVESHEWNDVSKYRSSPGRRILENLMLQTVSVPRWWLKEVKPSDGYVDLTEPPRWLSVEKVLILKVGRWSGRNAKGEPIWIDVDEELGVRLVEVGEQSDEYL